MPSQDSDQGSNSQLSPPLSNRNSPVLPPIVDGSQKVSRTTPNEGQKRTYAFYSEKWADRYLETDNEQEAGDVDVTKNSSDERCQSRNSNSSFNHRTSNKNDLQNATDQTNDSINSNTQDVDERTVSQNSSDRMNSSESHMNDYKHSNEMNFDDQNEQDTVKVSDGQNIDTNDASDQKHDSKNSSSQNNDYYNSSDQNNDPENSNDQQNDLTDSASHLNDSRNSDASMESDERFHVLRPSHADSGSISLSRGSSKLSTESDVFGPTPHDRFLDSIRPERRSYMSNRTPRKFSIDGNMSEAKSPGMSSHGLQSRPGSSQLNPGKRTPPSGPYFPMKHRPHVMDLNYDPLLDSDLPRPKTRSPDILVIDPRSESDDLSEQSKEETQEQMPDSERADDAEQASHVSQSPEFAADDTDESSRRQPVHERQLTLIRMVTDDAENFQENLQETPRSSQSLDESHLLLAPEIRIEKCSTGVLSSTGMSSGVSTPRPQEASISDSEEYDTDLEDDFERPSKLT